MKNGEMSLTLITKENESAFHSAIGDCFAEKQEDDLFIGVVDEKGAAAAAGAFREENGVLQLLRIASDEGHRGKGCAYFLMEEMKKRARAAGLSEIGTYLFAREEDGEGEWMAWLKRQGFEIAHLPAKRYGISLAALYEKQPFAGRRLRKGEKIRFLKNQKYGFELVKETSVRATLLAEDFHGDIYLSLVDAEPGYFSDVKLLIDEALLNVREKAPEAKLLYTDINSYRLMDYVERSLKNRGLEIEEELSALYAAFAMEEDSDE